LNTIFQIHNGYKYNAYGYKNLNDNKIWIKLGCMLFDLDTWEFNFWNNVNEFPNDGTENSINRLRVYLQLKNLLTNDVNELMKAYL